MTVGLIPGKCCISPKNTIRTANAGIVSMGQRHCRLWNTNLLLSEEGAEVVYVPFSDTRGGNDMELLAEEIRGKRPKLYSQENNPNPIVHVKFFTPWSNWTWYVIEGEPVLDENRNKEDFLFYGLVTGFLKGIW